MSFRTIKILVITLLIQIINVVLVRRDKLHQSTQLDLLELYMWVQEALILRLQIQMPSIKLYHSEFSFYPHFLGPVI